LRNGQVDKLANAAALRDKEKPTKRGGSRMSRAFERFHSAAMEFDVLLRHAHPSRFPRRIAE
jgi:hypothetical protein